MVARRYGQDPRSVAHWEADWLAAAVTAMEAENAADAERRVLEERRAAMRRQMGGGR
jgi:hypothetical protein